MLIAGASSSAHRRCLLRGSVGIAGTAACGRAGAAWIARCDAVGSDEVVLDGRRIDRPGHTQRPSESPATSSKLDALHGWVQPDTTTRESPARIRHDRHHGGRRPRFCADRVRRHDGAEQICSRALAPAPDAGADRAGACRVAHSRPRSSVSDAVVEQTAAPTLLPSDSWYLTSRCRRSGALRGVVLGVAVDVDPAPGQSCRQSSVLPFAPDCE